MSATEVRVEVTASPSEADKAAVLDGLLGHNEPFLGRSDWCPIGVFASTAVGVVGGLYGETGRGFLQIDDFWVAAGHRRQGLGSRLLRAAEAEATDRGCHSAWLSTYDFQARPFYERHGYRLFGTLPGYPNDHASFFLVKRLAAEPA